VQLVHRAVDGGVRKLWPRQCVVPALELVFGRDAVRLGEAGTTGIVRLGDSHHSDFVGVLERVRAIGIHAAPARADHEGCDWFGHRLYTLITRQWTVCCPM
jgi:hypothetical protein